MKNGNNAKNTTNVLILTCPYTFTKKCTCITEGAKILNIELVKVDGQFFSTGEHLALSDIIDTLKSTDIVLKIKLEANIQNARVVSQLIDEIRRREINNVVIITLPVISPTFSWQQ